MHTAYPRLFERAVIGGAMNARHLERGAYVALPRAAALRVAAAYGGAAAEVSFPDGESFAPVRIRVRVRRRVEVAGRATSLAAVADGGRRRWRVRSRRRLRRAAGPAPGQADAPGRRAGLRPHGGRRPRGRGRAHRDQRVSLRRRAGRPVSPHP
jgi:hypothetical protein